MLFIIGLVITGIEHGGCISANQQACNNDTGGKISGGNLKIVKIWFLTKELSQIES